MAETAPSPRIRREPPAFRRLAVRQVTSVTPRLVRVTLGGPELEGFEVDQPAASIRLLIPASGGGDLLMPAWNGNEFLLPDGTRPVIRTLTPLRLHAGDHTLDVEIVVHDGGAVPAWALGAQPGHEAAISGPGRGYPVDPEAAGFVLAGDETAIPAISQLLGVLPPDRAVRVFVEVADPSARLDLPPHPAVAVDWFDQAGDAPPGDALLGVVTTTELPAGTRVWAAGEAAAMQRIRRHLFEERNLARSDTWIRGYWKRGRAGDAADH